MKTVSGLGIGLSLVFGCLLLALFAEIYYLLRWKKKKRKNKRVINQEIEEEDDDDDDNNNGYAKDLIQLFCFKKPQSLQHNNGGRRSESLTNPNLGFHQSSDLEFGLMKQHFNGDLGFEEELMKFHNQRFLFTIKEETKEDLLESDDGKSRKGSSRSRTRSLSDLPLGVNECNTPNFFTPLASPTAYSPHHGFHNPLFESEGELEFNRFFRSSSSPPPKFKFLRDAEEKLRKRLMEEAKKKHSSPIIEGSFLKFMNHQSSLSSSSSSLQVQILEH